MGWVDFNEDEKSIVIRVEHEKNFITSGQDV